MSKSIICFLVLLICPLISLADTKDEKFMGTASCSSSNCHGSINPRNGNNVLQNEYITWQKEDKHSQAYKTLLNEESKTIAKHLGINAPEKDPLCLNCHATYTNDKNKIAGKFQIEDGVSCESCHGTSSNWLSTHTNKGVTHKDNLSNGMKDLNNLSTQIKLCSGCHFGTDDKNVNHRLIGAGHPRLTFENDTFQTIMPRHWEIDKDYIQRKGNYNSIKSWLAGQLILAQEGIDKMLSKTRSKNGVFPEFSLFYCYSCHHSLSPKQWKTREYFGQPGELKLNISSLSIINIALNVIKPNLGTELQNLSKDLNHLYKGGSAEANLMSVKKLLTSKASFLTSEELSTSTQKKLLKALISHAADVPFLQYELAEQILMGISSILSTSSELNKLFKSDVDRLYETLQNEEEFVAENFTKACINLKSKVEKY